MKFKRLFKISAIIILGAITLFSFSNVQATESVFSDVTPTRSSAQAYTMTTFSNSQIVTPITLGISKSEFQTNVDNNGNGGYSYWTIKDSNGIYKDIYCLNLERGFGAPNGDITSSNSTKVYNNPYDLNSITSTQYSTLTGLSTANKNKILWILNNSLTSSDSLSVILDAASEKVEQAGWTSYVKEDMKNNNDTRTALTFEDIKMVQQIAIWHYTNSGSIFDNTLTGICDLNGNQISSQGENILVNTETYYNYVRSGLIKQAKLNALYQYFIDGAESGSSESVVPSLTLSNENVEVVDSENSYIVGPFSLTGENTAVIKEVIATSNIDYTLLKTASSTQEVANNDFRKVINSNFYLKIDKSKVTEDIKIELNLTYKYDNKVLTLLSNESDSTDTQPLVLVGSKEKTDNVNTTAQINITDIIVEKIWNDNNNQDGVKPKEVQVQLYKDGKVYGDSITLSESILTYTWDNLLDGYTYTVKELNSSGNPVEDGEKYNSDYTAKYQVSGNKTTITNTHVPETIDISGTKTWVDNNNQDGKRPESIVVNLLANGTEIKDVTVTAANDWKYSFTDLPKYESGEEIKYTITEDTVAEYEIEIDGYDITNKYTPETIDISGTKTWVDNNNQDGKRPESIVVNLLANGTEIKDVTVTAADDWKYSFTDLPKYEAGEEIKYTITEDTVAEYEIEIDGYDITNKYTPETIDISGTKTWVDNENQDGKRPESIVVNLLANGTEIKVVTVTAADDWKYSFTDLPKYEAGEKIKYTITEDKVTDYTTTIDGYNITNKYTPGKVSKTVIKEWKDNNNLDKIRPESIIVKLYKLENGQEVEIDTKELNESNNWTHTWIELDQKSNGENIVYGIKEITSVDGYVTEYSIPEHVYNDEDTITITNTHISNEILIGLQKVDEQGNVITSSEATFEIKGDQELTAQTDKGILDLDSEKLINNEFEFTYTIKEKDAPNGYEGILEDLTVKISGTTKLENGSYIIDTIDITDKDGNQLDNTKISAEYDETLNKVVIKVVNKKITNAYSVRLLKVSEDGTTPIGGAWFKIDGGQAILVSETGEEIATGTLSQEGELNLTYKLEETVAPDGYIKIEEPREVKINAKVELIDDEYQLTEVKLKEQLDGITVSEENNVITINVENKIEITGKYNVILRKVDENGNVLVGSKFEINGTEYELPTGEVTIVEDTNIISDKDIDFTYLIKEIEVPEGYNGIEDKVISLKAKVEKQDNKYKIIRAILVDSEGNTITDEDISVKIEGDSIVIVVKNTPIEKKFDLALRKFITKINEIEYSREPVVDTSTIASIGTATYKHTKEPIAVQKGDVITYTIRVYNEGELDGYVDKITDYLPDNLLPIIEGIEGIDSQKYKDEIEFNSNWLWIYSEDGKVIETTITSKLNTETYSILTGLEEVADTKLDAYVEGADKLDYIDAQIKCLVKDSAVSNEYLTNIAEITESQDINGVQGDGIDSKLGNVDYSNLSDYKNNEAINSSEDSYVEGQEDDDDFEKLVVKEFDLSLRKFITKVNETSYSREPVVDTSKLGTTVDGKVITTAIYNHSKEPIIVETDDIVTYTIRIYNEGTLAGFANEITDDIPEGLEFMPSSSVNVSYRWKMLDSDGNETDDVSKAVMIVTDYLSDIDKNNIINAVSEVDGVKTLSYKDVEVQFKVIAKAEKLKDNIIINEAQISSDSDRDIDSVPNRDEKYDYNSGNNEDDIDYEPIKLKYFDLALRKFITKVNAVDYNNRYPEIIYNEDGSITYNQTKDPVLVTTNDVVVYTIRVYNEGEKAGYATEIIDNLPDGLEFISDNEINKKYGWKILDSQGNVTEEMGKAAKFSTDYLKDEIISPLVEENGQKILSYKDVQIAFKVIEPNTSDRILVNIAEISNDSDNDIDSIPGNNELTEDDIDREYIKVQYFDLSLEKWVTRTEVTYNGKTTVTKTGFTADTDEIAKVDLVASKMNKTTVKFAYNIKVTNEGELPGYVYEIEDYIPKGLKFVAEDNKDWKELEDGSVVTDKLKDTLLNPGESATVEIVLTWKNSTTNTGLKTNYAEIRNDSADDIDSVPGNEELTEDDIDDAQVILSIKTAGAPTYIGLIFITVAILAGGIFLIKKYVI